MDISIILTSHFLIKLSASILVIFLLVFIAEKVDVSLSGIFSGFPTGTALLLFFYALDNGVDFSLNSSRYNLAALLAQQMFVLVFYLTSKKVVLSNIIISSLLAILAFLITIFLLHYLNLTLYAALLIPIISIPIFQQFFRKIPVKQISRTEKLPVKTILFRIIVAIVIILTISELSKFITFKNAGLFSAFPTTVFPTLIIITLSHGREYANSIVRNIPKGHWFIIIYVILINILYPSIGYLWGSISSITLTFSLLLLYILFQRKSWVN